MLSRNELCSSGWDASEWIYSGGVLFYKGIVYYNTENGARYAIYRMQTPIKYRGHKIMKTHNGLYFDLTAYNWYNENTILSAWIAYDLSSAKKHIDMLIAEKNKHKTINIIKV